MQHTDNIEAFLQNVPAKFQKLAAKYFNCCMIFFFSRLAWENVTGVNSFRLVYFFCLSYLLSIFIMDPLMLR